MGLCMSKRTLIIAGTTGLVGQQLLLQALNDESIGCIHSLSRRELGVLPDKSNKVQSHIVDFAQLPTLPYADELYLALGTTIKVAGSQAAFRAVDYDANLAVARAALARGIKRVGLVSSMGADAHSRVFYSRIKGELEEAINALGFEGQVFVRPSFLVGDRAALGQPVRRGEALGIACFRYLKPLIPKHYRAVAASDVASTLLANVPKAYGSQVLLSGELHSLDVSP